MAEKKVDKQAHLIEDATQGNAQKNQAAKFRKQEAELDDDEDLQTVDSKLMKY